MKCASITNSVSLANKVKISSVIFLLIAFLLAGKTCHVSIFFITSKLPTTSTTNTMLHSRVAMATSMPMLIALFCLAYINLLR